MNTSIRALVLVCLAAFPFHAALASAADQQALRQRVQGYWDAKVERSKQRFAFYVPEEKGGPRREKTPEYGALQYTAYEVLGVTIQGDSATVRTKNVYRLLGRGVRVSKTPREKTLTQTWIRVDGEWYRKAPKPGMRLAERFRASQRASKREAAPAE